MSHTKNTIIAARTTKGDELRGHRQQGEYAGDANQEEFRHRPPPGAGPGTGTKLSERRCHVSP